MNILIPTDFSENSRNATAYAMAYFANVAVDFYFLHTSQAQTILSDEADLQFSNVNTETPPVLSASELMTETLHECRLKSKNPEHRFFPLIESSNLVEAIRKKVAQREIDYIVMGTRGTTRYNSKELGSNTCDVITKVKCPILVIPENARFNDVKNISFLTDYNCIYRNKIITRLAETLDLHSSPLRVLHIKAQNTGLTAAQTDNKGFLHYFFKDKKHSFHVVENKELEAGIQDFVETWDISLVSIVAKNLNLIQRLLLRPTVKTLDFSLNVPFLVLHE